MESSTDNSGLPYLVEQALDHGVFRPEWYTSKYPDIAKAGIDPEQHFRSSGFWENRSPHPLFDPDYYAEEYDFVATPDRPALLDYLECGAHDHRSTHPMIWSERYRQVIAESGRPARGSILLDFCQEADRSDAFVDFDVDCYRAQTGLSVDPNRLIEHFLTVGLFEAISPHPLIDLSFASSQTGLPPADLFYSLFYPPHSAAFQIHPAFDGDFYIRKTPDVEMHPILHYLRYWRERECWPNPIFSTKLYMASACDDAVVSDPLSDYLSDNPQGEPNPFFSSDWYCEQYKETMQDGETALEHYLRLGHLPYFDPSPKFYQRYYLSRTPAVLERDERPLAHFLHAGNEEGKRRKPISPYFDDSIGFSLDEIISQIVQYASPAHTDCDVDIIIPCYTHAEVTARCILGVLRAKTEASFRIVLADDASPDGSGEIFKNALSSCPQVDVKAYKENLGFLKNCVRAAAETSSPHIVFLNNDTVPLDHWLDELLDVCRSDDKAGVVGSSLLYPDGLLQEAGGVVWNDGGAANVGRRDDPETPSYSYLRQVDYVSGAAFLTPRSVWDSLGGFSEEFAPAYYEDTDFCMKARRAGYHVYVQPLSNVIHYEGVSSGTDVESGVKRFQVINREKFRDKWSVELANHPAPGSIDRVSVDRAPKGRILVFDALVPTPDKDSGSVTAFNYMRIWSELGYRVTFLPENLKWSGKYALDLQRMGVEVLRAPHIYQPTSYLMENAGDFDMVMLSRGPSGGVQAKKLRERYPDLPICFDTVDLHYLRLEREAALSGEHEDILTAARMKQIELEAIANADVTLLVSQHEVDVLQDELGGFAHAVLPLIYGEFPEPAAFEKRKDIAFVGGYQHPPNVDAARWLVEEVWPAVRERNLGAKLLLIGSSMPSYFNDWAADDIEIVGFVEDLDALLSEVKMTLAPLRYGAGVKGKVGNSLRLGVPVVATSVAAEGMGLVDQEHILIANTPSSFASSIEQLYTDENLWTRLSGDGQAFSNSMFGLDRARDSLGRLTRSLIARNTK